LQPYQHLIVWGYALSSTLPPLIRHKYGPQTIASYCYFTDPLDPRRLLVYIPVGISCVFNIYLIFDAIWFFYIRRSSLVGVEVAIIRRLALMVFVFNCLWGLAMGSRLYDAITDSDNSGWGTLVDAANTLSGFCNFVVWGMSNPRVLNWIYLKVGSRSHSLYISSAADDDPSSYSEPFVKSHTATSFHSTFQFEPHNGSFRGSFRNEQQHQIFQLNDEHNTNLQSQYPRESTTTPTVVYHSEQSDSFPREHFSSPIPLTKIPLASSSGTYSKSFQSKTSNSEN